MLKLRRSVLSRFRQGDPQLNRVYLSTVRRRLFRVADPTTGGHQINLIRTNHLLIAQAIFMQYLTRQHPCEGLQTNMRVRTDLQTRFTLGKNRRAGMIEKAPRANTATLGGRQ